jgi:hypothetical protein
VSCLVKQCNVLMWRCCSHSERKCRSEISFRAWRVHVARKDERTAVAASACEAGDDADKQVMRLHNKNDRDKDGRRARRAADDR